MTIPPRFHLVEMTLGLLFAAGTLAAAEPSPEKPLTVKGGRFLTLNAVIRVNQKHRRPEDAPVPLKNLTEEEQTLIKNRCPGL